MTSKRKKIAKIGSLAVITISCVIGLGFALSNNEGKGANTSVEITKSEQDNDKIKISLDYLTFHNLISLVDAADVIFVGKVVDAGSVVVGDHDGNITDSEVPRTHYRVSVVEAIKGIEAGTESVTV